MDWFTVALREPNSAARFKQIKRLKSRTFLRCVNAAHGSKGLAGLPSNGFGQQGNEIVPESEAWLFSKKMSLRRYAAACFDLNFYLTGVIHFRISGVLPRGQFVSSHRRLTRNLNFVSIKWSSLLKKIFTSSFRVISIDETSKTLRTLMKLENIDETSRTRRIQLIKIIYLSAYQGATSTGNNLIKIRNLHQPAPFIKAFRSEKTSEKLRRGKWSETID